MQVLQNERLLALYEQDGDRAEVFYAIYRHLEELKDLLCRRGVRRFSLTGSAGNPDLENLEATILAEVTQEKRLVMDWNGSRIVDLPRSFLDSNGAEKHISVKAPYYTAV